jgi:hypothetical protein
MFLLSDSIVNEKSAQLSSLKIEGKDRNGTLTWMGPNIQKTDGK